MRSLSRFIRRRFPIYRSIPRAPGLHALLGRKPVNLDTPELQRFLAGKRVLITGAGGSIGSEICRQSMRFCPGRLLMMERAENALFEIDRELRHSWVGSDIQPIVGDVCDAARVKQVFESHRPQVLFHCAAHKHVPMMERNAGEAVKNNVFGTQVVADAALEAGVQAFVLVSTDKAVNPSSVMGATKRVAELYVQGLNERQEGRSDEATERRSDEGEKTFSSPFVAPSLRRSVASTTRFLAVRFGNVLGSSGSVVPIFQKQIEAGGPVTVTHPEMTRYFMTIPEASQLVMQAGAIGKGGEIFVLEMGEQIKILDLARELIRRNNLRPHEDIEIRFTGIRSGEKLHEELAGNDEPTRPTAHPMIRVRQSAPADRLGVQRALEDLRESLSAGSAEVIAALRRCVPEYRSPLSTGGEESPAPSLRLVAGSAAEAA